MNEISQWGIAGLVELTPLLANTSQKKIKYRMNNEGIESGLHL